MTEKLENNDRQQATEIEDNGNCHRMSELLPLDSYEKISNNT